MANKSDRQMAALTGAQIRDVLPQLSEIAEDGILLIAHEATAAECMEYYFRTDAAAEGLEFSVCDVKGILQLTDSGREQYTELLDAQIEGIREIPFGHVAVIRGVDPQELERFTDAYADFLDAEQRMGPTM